jgi:hypothetical protein
MLIMGRTRRTEQFIIGYIWHEKRAKRALLRVNDGQ